MTEATKTVLIAGASGVIGAAAVEHFAALGRLGPTIHHRRSFSPVAGALGLIDDEADEAIAGVLPL